MPAPPAPQPASVLEHGVWTGRVAVLSPHLDDAVLSVGASIHAAVRRGAEVQVITVLAGRPESRTPADESNRRAGFATAGAAATARREEDARACRRLGATPVWLAFPDDRNEPPPADAAVAAELARSLAGCDAVLVPGFPLDHPQHAWASRLAVRVAGAGFALGLYVEQPYATWMALSRAGGRRAVRPHALPSHLGLDVRPRPVWRRARTRPADWAAKLRAAGEYRSQLRVLRRGPRLRIAGYEALHGGERILWCRLEGGPA